MHDRWMHLPAIQELCHTINVAVLSCAVESRLSVQVRYLWCREADKGCNHLNVPLMASMVEWSETPSILLIGIDSELDEQLTQTGFAYAVLTCARNMQQVLVV